MSRGRLWRALAPGSLLCVLFLLCCRIPSTRISPPPAQIEGMEGYASLKLKGEQGSTRSRFSFLFQFPGQARIDVSDVLGRTLYQIMIGDNQAFLFIPSKKVYWQGEEGDIIHRFLGFRLNFDELVSLLSGQWGEEDFGIEDWKREWILQKDNQGRVVRGMRRDLGFEVIEFFPDTSVVRILDFHHPLTRGRLKVLSIGFNPPLKKGFFSYDFLRDYQRKSWAEIEDMLNEKN
ncbi:MAG: hypothetical protein ACLFVG_01110 [Candidatus Aminicenantes bacterium]